jgi:aryl-alcohol dehydrogenase-like predicted oxidoreductase
MKYRVLGKTGLKISEVSLGAWQLGGKWGSSFDEDGAAKTLNTAIDLGINFIDTADVYSDGLSERSTGQVVKSRKENVFIASKCGRRLNPHNVEGYNRENIRGFVQDSLNNMKLKSIDLIQLHCPPTEVYSNPEVFKALDELKEEGKILNYGVSVEKVEEALKAIEYEGVSSIQIIFNMFRQKPAEKLFDEAKRRNVGIIARVPLASGLLTGKLSKESAFDKGDHRLFNRNGEFFDKGETFSGVDFETGLKAVEELKEIFDYPQNLAQYALRWILMFDAVSCVIPGASNLAQAQSNVAASSLPPLSKEQMKRVREVYEKYIMRDVQGLW